MRSFNIKSIILGIGIGIILTSVTSMVYLHGITPVPVLGREDVKKLAAEYGLLDTDKYAADISQKKDTTQKTTTGANNVSILINEGDTCQKVAEKLLAAGLITDVETAAAQMKNSGVESNLKAGMHMLVSGSDMAAIIGEITRSK